MTRRNEQRTTWRVLMAEDNDDHALLIQMALERASRLPIELYRARNGTEAVGMVHEVVPDLILLDLEMPGRSGHEVLEAVKSDEQLRRIPVAVLTSSDRHEDLAKSYGLGGNHFITKPENPIELESELRLLLRNVEELSSIRRGPGELAATAESAMGPGSLEARKAILWAVFALILVSLVIFAYALDVL